MSVLSPVLRATGPVAPAEITSEVFKAPTLTRRDFQILFVVITVKISVKVLKQSLLNKVTSKKNWWFRPVQSMSFGL